MSANGTLLTNPLVAFTLSWAGWTDVRKRVRKARLRRFATERNARLEDMSVHA